MRVLPKKKDRNPVRRIRKKRRVCEECGKSELVHPNVRNKRCANCVYLSALEARKKETLARNEWKKTAPPELKRRKLVIIKRDDCVSYSACRRNAAMENALTVCPEVCELYKPTPAHQLTDEDVFCTPEFELLGLS